MKIHTFSSLWSLIPRSTSDMLSASSCDDALCDISFSLDYIELYNMILLYYHNIVLDIVVNFCSDIDNYCAFNKYFPIYLCI